MTVIVSVASDSMFLIDDKIERINEIWQFFTLVYSCNISSSILNVKPYPIREINKRMNFTKEKIHPNTYEKNDKHKIRIIWPKQQQNLTICLKEMPRSTPST